MDTEFREALLFAQEFSLPAPFLALANDSVRAALGVATVPLVWGIRNDTIRTLLQGVLDTSPMSVGTSWCEE